MLVLEFMGGGDLAKAMAKERGGPRRFSWHVNGRFILLGIAWGIAYIHSKGVIYASQCVSYINIKTHIFAYCCGFLVICEGIAMSPY